jgi:peptidoglycan/xylan/chitin deacetylase (PgdA/CDA1 family)
VEPDALVLCYHAISDTWPATLAVPQRSFERQLRFLRDRGYRSATFAETASGVGHRTVAITFDDAFRSVLDNARPVLSSLGFVATVFAVTDFAASGKPLAWRGIDHWAAGPHGHELRGLDWSELRLLQNEGWEIGSHTCTHPHLTRRNDAELLDELRRSRQACENALDRPCRSLAYPYGDVDARVIDATAVAGYAAAATLPPRLGPQTPLAWPRVGVYRGDSYNRFRLKASRSVRRARTRLGR